MADNKLDISIKQAVNAQAQRQQQANTQQQTAGLKSPLANQQKLQQNISGVLKLLSSNFAALKSLILKSNKESASTLTKLNKNILTLTAQQKTQNTALENLNKAATTIVQNTTPSKLQINTFNQKEFSLLLVKYFEDINSKLLQIHTLIYLKFSNLLETIDTSNLLQSIETLQIELSTKLQEIIDKDSNSELIAKLQEILDNNNAQNKVLELTNISQTLNTISENLNKNSQLSLLEVLNDINQNISNNSKLTNNTVLNDSINKIISILLLNSQLSDKQIDISNIEEALNNFLTLLKSENSLFLLEVKNNSINLTAAPLLAETNTFDFLTIKNINENINNASQNINLLVTPVQNILKNTITILQAIRELNNLENAIENNISNSESKLQQIKLEINSIINKEKLKLSILQISSINASLINYLQLTQDIQQILNLTANISELQLNIATTTLNIENNMTNENLPENILLTTPTLNKTHLLTINKISSQTPLFTLQNTTSLQKTLENQPEQTNIDTTTILQDILQKNDDILNTNIEKYSDLNANLIEINLFLASNKNTEKSPVLITITGTNTEITSSKLLLTKLLNSLKEVNTSTTQNTLQKTVVEKLKEPIELPTQQLVTKQPKQEQITQLQINHKIEITINGLNTNIVTSGDKRSNNIQTSVNTTQQTALQQNSGTTNQSNNQATLSEGIKPISINGIPSQSAPSNTVSLLTPSAEDLIKVNTNTLKAQTFLYLKISTDILKNNTEIAASNNNINLFFLNQNQSSLLEDNEFKTLCNSSDAKDIETAISLIDKKINLLESLPDSDDIRILKNILNEVKKQLSLKHNQIIKNNELQQKKLQLNNQIKETLLKIDKIKTTTPLVKELPKEETKLSTGDLLKKELANVFFEVASDITGQSFNFNLDQSKAVEMPPLPDSKNKSLQLLKEEAYKRFTSLTTNNKLIDLHANAYMKGRFKYVYEKFPDMSSKQINIIGLQMLNLFNLAWDKGYVLVPNEDGSQFAQISKQLILAARNLNKDVTKLLSFIAPPNISTQENALENLEANYLSSLDLDQFSLNPLQSLFTPNLNLQPLNPLLTLPTPSTMEESTIELPEQTATSTTLNLNFREILSEGQELPLLKLSSKQTTSLQNNLNLLFKDVLKELLEDSLELLSEEKTVMPTPSTTLQQKQNISTLLELSLELSENELTTPNKLMPKQLLKVIAPTTLSSLQKQIKDMLNLSLSLEELPTLLTAKPEKTVQTTLQLQFSDVLKELLEDNLELLTSKLLTPTPTTITTTLHEKLSIAGMLNDGLELLEELDNALNLKAAELAPTTKTTTLPADITEQRRYYNEQRELNTNLTNLQKQVASQLLVTSKLKALPITAAKLVKPVASTTTKLTKPTTSTPTSTPSTVIKNATDFSTQEKPKKEYSPIMQLAMKTMPIAGAQLQKAFGIPSGIFDGETVGGILDVFQDLYKDFLPKSESTQEKPLIKSKSTKPKTDGIDSKNNYAKAEEESKKLQLQKEQAQTDQLVKSQEATTAAINNSTNITNVNNVANNNKELLVGINNLIQASKPLVIYIFADLQNSKPEVKTFVNIG